MLEDNLLYHGSNAIVNRSKVVINDHYKDFGYGFHCVNMKKQARCWALMERKAFVVNCYIYTKNKKLPVCSFSKMTDAWLDSMIACRRGVEHTYDIAGGPMADDQIWDYVGDSVSGIISRAAFWELVEFKYPTHQISFRTEDTLATLQYERSYIL